MIRRPPRSTRTDTRFPYTTLFRSRRVGIAMALTRLSLTVNNNTENHHFTARLTGALSRLQGQRKRSSTGFLHFPPRPCEAINVDKIGRASCRERVCQYV